MQALTAIIIIIITIITIITIIIAIIIAIIITTIIIIITTIIIIIIIIIIITAMEKVASVNISFYNLKFQASLMAVFLIRHIMTIIIVVTFPGRRDTTAIVTCELCRAAGVVRCKTKFVCFY